jgi:hypothetical protein
MKTIRNLCFLVLCTAFALSWQAGVSANWFILPGAGCGCEDPFECVAECGNACLYECNRLSVTCHVWDYICYDDECWCGWEPS